MGFAIAEELAKHGAEVTLICGHNLLETKHPDIKRIDIITADEMYRQCIKYFKNSDIIVMAAAVADFKPAKAAKEKIKKDIHKKNIIEITPTKDILLELGKRKTDNQILVGFALETENEIRNAKKKLQNKNLDFVVLNSLKDKESGFGYDTNKITIINKENKMKKFELMSKKNAAKEIVEHIISGGVSSN